MHARRFGVAAVVAIVLIITAFVGWNVLRPPYVVSLGTPIRHDDFLFTVTRVQRQELADGTLLYRVGIRVENQAKVVGYTWRDAIAYVRAFDKNGFGHDYAPM